MNFGNLKYGKCPQCNQIFTDETLEIYEDEEVKENIVHHKPCGFKVMEIMYLRSLEQGKAELAAMEAIDKLSLNADLFKMFCVRFLTAVMHWKVKDIGSPQVVRNNKGGPTDFFLAIPFVGKMPKPKNVVRPVNQGKRRGFTKAKKMRN